MRLPRPGFESAGSRVATFSTEHRGGYAARRLCRLTFGAERQARMRPTRGPTRRRRSRQSANLPFATIEVCRRRPRESASVLAKTDCYEGISPRRQRSAGRWLVTGFHHPSRGPWPLMPASLMASSAPSVSSPHCVLTQRCTRLLRNDARRSYATIPAHPSRSSNRPSGALSRATASGLRRLSPATHQLKSN